MFFACMVDSHFVILPYENPISIRACLMIFLRPELDSIIKTLSCEN